MHDDEVDDTVIRPRRDPLVPPAHDAVGDTVIRPRPGAPVYDSTAVLGDDAVVLGDDAAVVDDSAAALDDTVVGGGRHVLRGASAVGSPVAAPTPLPPVPPVRRPVASIRLSGRVIPLDHPVVVGRQPSGPRVAGRVLPELVAVPSPSGQVSGTHVTIHAEGDAVVVADMRSTNGTFVRVPGAAPLRMRAGATMVVLTGTVVDIGDGVTIEILSPHQRLRPDGSALGTYDTDATVPPMPGHPGADPRGAGSPGLGSPEAERLTS